MVAMPRTRVALGCGLADSRVTLHFRRVGRTDSNEVA